MTVKQKKAAKCKVLEHHRRGTKKGARVPVLVLNNKVYSSHFLGALLAGMRMFDEAFQPIHTGAAAKYDLFFTWPRSCPDCASRMNKGRARHQETIHRSVRPQATVSPQFESMSQQSVTVRQSEDSV